MKFSITALGIVLLQAMSVVAVPASANQPETCEDTLCYKMDSYPKCSERWYAALNDCYGPPCNIAWFQDPAHDCHTVSKEKN